MKKRIICMVIALAMLVTFFPVTAEAAESWLWPAEGCYIVHSNFGWRSWTDQNGYHEDNHGGIDISGANQTAGMPVRATKSGEIFDGCNNIPDNTYISGSCGNYTCIDHGDGTFSIYMHMKPGNTIIGTVQQGETIGYIGNTGESGGYHLHFELYTQKWNRQGSRLNPMPTNPEITIVHRNEYVLPNGWPSEWITYVFAAGNPNKFIGSRNAVGDFNGDGLDDYAVMYDYGRARAQLHVFLSTGLGFSEEVWWEANEVNAFDAARASGRFVAGDFNGDGLDDIAVMYEYSDQDASLFVFLSTGSRFLTWSNWLSCSEYKATAVTDRFVAGDFNGDGMDDIAAMYKYSDTYACIHVFLSSGNAFSIANAQWLALPEYDARKVSGRMTAGDFNGDGADDIAAMYEYGDVNAQIHVFLSKRNAFEQGVSWYSNETGFTAARTTGRFTSGDFNGDGLDDIAAMYDYGSLTAVDLVWLSQQTQFTGEQHWYSHYEFAPECVNGRYYAGDLNGDGKSDLASLYCYTDKSVFHVMTADDSSFVGASWNRINGYDCTRTGGTKSYWDEDYAASFTLTPTTHHLDVNAYLDGQYLSEDFSYIATFDVYIRGERRASDISDYYRALPHGTTYEIKNVRVKDGYTFKGAKTGICEGVASSDLTGTIGSDETYVFLDFETQACQHNWGSGVVTTEPTCTTEGVRTYTCSLCGETKTESIPAKGHNYVDCVCTRCGASNDPNIHSGKCGDNAVWSLNQDGKLHILGTGTMANYDWNKTPWNDWKGQIKEVVIDEGVTTIGGAAFEHCENLTKITMPESVTSIGRIAFDNCKKLPSIRIPAKVTSIGMFAFQGCNGMTYFDVADGNSAYKSIDGVLFSKDGSTLLIYPKSKDSSTYQIPEGTKNIEQNAFRDCNTLTKLVIPAGLTSIGDYAFSRCLSLKQIHFNGDVPTIASYAFAQIEATGYYPAGNSTWTGDKMQNYGGTLTWKSYTPQGATPMDITVGRVTAHAGETVSVPVCVQNNPGIAGFTFTIQYCDDEFILTDIKKGDLLKQNDNGLFTPNVSGNRVTWISPVNISGEGEILQLLFRVANKVNYGRMYEISLKLADNQPSNLVDEHSKPVTPEFKAGSLLLPPLIDVPAAMQGDSEIEVKVLDAQENVVASGHVGDELSIPNVEGNYQFRMSKEGYVTKIVTVTIDDTVASVNLGEVELVRIGNVNGATTKFGEVGVDDMQCLFTRLSTGKNEGQITDEVYFKQVCDVNTDGVVNILDYQALYEVLKSMQNT